MGRGVETRSPHLQHLGSSVRTWEEATFQNTWVHPYVRGKRLAKVDYCDQDKGPSVRTWEEAGQAVNSGDRTGFIRTYVGRGFEESKQ
jgi:hypothetical protein